MFSQKQISLIVLLIIFTNMKRIIAIISAATTVLAFYNEARRAGLVESLNIEPINLFGHKGKHSKNDEEDNGNG